MANSWGCVLPCHLVEQGREELLYVGGPLDFGQLGHVLSPFEALDQVGQFATGHQGVGRFYRAINTIWSAVDGSRAGSRVSDGAACSHG